jgi:A/G-specific adenine glycosylase
MKRRSNIGATDISNAQYPGDVNQALIELGSTVCKVNDPDCGSCPLQKRCSANRMVSMPEKHEVAITVSAVIHHH